MELHALYRHDALGEDHGYVPTSEVIGFVILDGDGKEIASGETADEAMQNALEIVWRL